MRITVPPVVQVALVGALMWLVHYFGLGPELTFAGRGLLARACFLIGVLILAAAVVAFIRQKTTVSPMAPSEASKLVTQGLFRFSRNPMYLAMLLLLTGWAILLSNPVNALALIGFVWFMTEFQIKPEEEALRDKFGEEYAEYCRKTRRWI